MRDNVAFWLCDTTFNLYPIRNLTSINALPNSAYYIILENF